MFKPQIAPAQSSTALSNKQDKIFEMRETLLSDGSRLFEVCCIGQRIFAATSKSEAEDRCYALENALNLFHLSFALVGDPNAICIESTDEVQPFYVKKTSLSDESDVYGIFCNGEEIYAATSEDDATDRCLTLRNAISISPANAMETIVKNRWKNLPPP